MVLDALIYLFHGICYVLSSPLRIFSDAALPSGMATALANIGQYLTPISSFLPVSTLLTITALYLSIEAAIITYKLVMWFIHLIRG